MICPACNGTGEFQGGRMSIIKPVCRLCNGSGQTDQGVDVMPTPSFNPGIEIARLQTALRETMQERDGAKQEVAVAIREIERLKIENVDLAILTAKKIYRLQRALRGCEAWAGELADKYDALSKKVET